MPAWPTFLQRLFGRSSSAAAEVMGPGLYPAGYRPKPVAEQEKILRSWFLLGGFGDPSTHARVPGALPPDAVGWFVVPRTATYDQALDKVLAALRRSRHGEFEYGRWETFRRFMRHVRPRVETDIMLSKVAKEQGEMWRVESDAPVLPVTFRLRRRAATVFLARATHEGVEFDLGAFQVGCMLLTHPELLQRDTDLPILCAGDEYSRRTGRSPVVVPYFSFEEGKLGCGLQPKNH